MVEVRGPFRRSRVDTVDGGYGRVPAATQPAPDEGEDVQFRPMDKKDAARLLDAELLDASRKLCAAATDLTGVVAGLQPVANGVLLVALVALDGDGHWQYDGRVTIGSAIVENHDEAEPIYVQSGTGSSAPGAGRGVQLVRPGHRLPLPIGANSLTVWGPAGTLVNIQAFTGLQALGAVR